MKKIMRIATIVTLMVSNIFVYEGHYINSYAQDFESNLDLLILNREAEKELKLKLDVLNEELNNKIEKITALENGEKENEVEVVKLSFVHEDTIHNDNLESTDILKEDIVSIQDEIKDIDRIIQQYIIEEVKLEKILEQEKRAYIKENNLDYIEGCWPVPSYTQISSPFGDRIHPITNKPSFHRGIDIPAPQYTDIVASDDGIVIYSGIQNGYGNVVKIKHFDGKVTIYAHNTSNIVKQGDVIRRGQVIAQVGSTGDSTGNHVHFETIVNEVNINPVKVVSTNS